MKLISNYQAEDGRIFSNQLDCEEYEVILKEVNEFLKQFPNKEKYNDDCSFSNGDGFIQHDLSTYSIIEKKLIELSNRYFKEEEPFTQFNYYLGRIIDDSNTRCINKLSYKLMCIDKQGREFGQPYYCLNPDKAKLIQLN